MYKRLVSTMILVMSALKGKEVVTQLSCVVELSGFEVKMIFFYLSVGSTMMKMSSYTSTNYYDVFVVVSESRNSREVSAHLACAQHKH